MRNLRNVESYYMQNHRAIGDIGEDMACRYLKRKKYKIVERNFYCKSGEIDIIAMKNAKYFFVEVKLRQNRKYGTALEGITTRKLKRIKMTIQSWFAQNQLDFELFGAIIGVAITKVNDKFKIELIDIGGV